jgi:hypothetical protein
VHKLIAEHAEDETIAVEMANVILEMGGRLVSVTDKGGPASGASEGRFIIWSEWSSEELLDKYKLRLAIVRETEPKMMTDQNWWEKVTTNKLDINDAFPFGKYKGQPMWAVDYNYFKWLMEQDWLDKYPNVLEYITRKWPDMIRSRRTLPPLLPPSDIKNKADVELDHMAGITPENVAEEEAYRHMDEEERDER